MESSLTFEALRTDGSVKNDSSRSFSPTNIERFDARNGFTSESNNDPFDAVALLRLGDRFRSTHRHWQETPRSLCLPPVEVVDPKALTHSAETKLGATIDKSVTDVKVREELRKDLKKFEERADKLGLTDKQVSKGLTEVNDLLASIGDPKITKVSEAMRLIAARGLMHNMAEPDVVSQGAHPTCGVASLEHKIFVRHPEIAASMVTAAALKGEWTGSDGKVIKIPDGSLVPGREERRYPPSDGDRSFASQLFEVVAINDIGQHVKKPMSYLEETKLDSAGKVLSTHEFWILDDGSKRSFELPGHGVFSTTGGLTSFGVANEVFRLTGERNGVLTDREFDDDDTPAEDLPRADIKNDNLTDIRTEKQLEDRLKVLKAEKNLPAECIVWAAGAADLTGRTADKVDDPAMKGKTQPNHVITVDDYEPAKDGKPARVLLHNQWGSWYNGWMNLDKFFKCMK